jgi:hypothetical protein
MTILTLCIGIYVEIKLQVKLYMSSFSQYSRGLYMHTKVELSGLANTFKRAKRKRKVNESK